MPPVNSIHAVSDRDSVIEIAQLISMFGLHISRFCEEIIFLSASPVQILKLPPEWSSGSSIMPNKRNPDFFEVIRAKSKKLIGMGADMMSMNMGLASGYASDFHEQKRLILLTLRDLKIMLPIIKVAFSALLVDVKRTNELLVQGHILATDVANLLVSQGATFRDAYSEVANQVNEISAMNEQIGTSQISFSSAVESRSNFGGTSKARVVETIHWLKSQLSEL